MYRRHYNAIAAALRSGEVSKTILIEIAYLLTKTSETFDQERFIDKALHGKTQEQRSAKHARELERSFARRHLKQVPGHGTP